MRVAGVAVVAAVTAKFTFQTEMLAFSAFIGSSNLIRRSVSKDPPVAPKVNMGDKRVDGTSRQVASEAARYVRITIKALQANTSYFIRIDSGAFTTASTGDAVNDRPLMARNTPIARKAARLLPSVNGWLRQRPWA